MPIPLRADFDADRVRAAARRSKDGPQARRLLALAAVYEGSTRTEAARIGGATVQIDRDWVVKFNAHGPDGLIDRKAPGQPRRLNDEHGAALAAVIESGPIPAIHGVVRWRIVDLCRPLVRSRILKSLPARLKEIGREQGVEPGAIEVWFADEARRGQKITRRWAKRDTRPSAPKDQRTASAYIFGAICPREGKGARLSSCRDATPTR
jgi:transposase